MLPNLLVIGAPKAGTTSLHAYLSEHPDIFMSEPKELRYFWRDDWVEQRAGYEAKFPVDAHVRGESTPTYAAWPHRLHVPQRIAQLIPDTKLIYLVRDPVERLASHWVQRVSDGDRTPLTRYLEQLDRPDNPIVCASRYMMQIDQYLAYFDPSRLLVVDQYELRHHRQQTLRRVLEFLGVDSDLPFVSLLEERNARADQVARRRLAAATWDRVLWPASRHVPEGVKQHIRRPANRLVYRQVTEQPELDEAARSRLRDFFRPDVERLRQFAHQGFASWSV
jgi:sulfotransferase family protein